MIQKQLEVKFKVQFFLVIKKVIKKERAVAEKLKVAEMIAEASFIQKRREAELQAEELKEEQELARLKQE